MFWNKKIIRVYHFIEYKIRYNAWRQFWFSNSKKYIKENITKLKLLINKEII